MFTILGGLAVLAVAFVLPALMLQLCCVICDVPVPRFWVAWATSLVGGLAAGLAMTAWGCTFGLMIGMFSGWASWGLQLVLGALVTAAVYQSPLKIRFAQALGLAVVYDVLGSALAGGVWIVVHWFVGW